MSAGRRSPRQAEQGRRRGRRSSPEEAQQDDGEQASRSAEEDSPSAALSQTTYTPRFTGFIVLFGVFVAAGLVTFHPAALAGAGLLLCFLVAGLLQTPALPGEKLRAEYRTDPAEPRPGGAVRVEVTVTNDSDETLTDLRLVDTVPEELRVVDGTPRAGTVLRPGEETTISYEVLARRGEYEFGPVVARTRTLMGSMWAQQPVPSDEQPEISCAVHAEDVPLEERAAHFIGGLLSQLGGDGVEFYATREYHRGDPPSRINWRELAKRDELSTITYRERQAANVTVITDARPQARVSAGAGEPSSATLAAYATYQVVSALIDDNHYVGVTVPGLRATPERRADSQFPCRRIDHGRGTAQRGLVFELFDEIERLEPLPGGSRRSGEQETFGRGAGPRAQFDAALGTTVEGFSRQVTGWASPNTQFVCVTPLLDGAVQGLCRRLRSRGYPVLVISPDVTAPMTPAAARESDATGSPPERLLAVQRAIRIEALRRSGCTVIDWDPGVALSVSCERQTQPGANT